MSPFILAPQTNVSKERLLDQEDSDDNEEDIIDRLPSMEDAAGHSKTSSSLLGASRGPGAFRSLSLSPSRLISTGGRLSPAHSRALSPVPHPPPHRHRHLRRRTWKSSLAGSWSKFWGRNRGVILVGSAQLFGALMNLAARLLELDGEGMHPFQILFARMSITAVLSCIYMYWTKVPFFPFGAKEVRWLLVARGLTGFFGIFPMWQSMIYLPLAEATVITFLAPSVSGYICHVVLKDPFTRREQLASFIALAGVILIARPTALFASSSDNSNSGAVGPIDSGSIVLRGTNDNSTMSHPGADEPTPTERLWGIGWALIGVMGAAGAYTMIRWIGKRAHPLISVNYFAVWCTIVSTTALTAAPLMGVGQPGIRFGLPASAYQWLLLLSLGLSGFIMQFMLTSGLGGEKSNRATAMLYTHMLFAAGFDRWVFGHRMGAVSLVGCGLILGSAMWAALSKMEKGKGWGMWSGWGMGVVRGG
ncbi:hypothetical protein B0T17DRAFT_483134 [Bombardia bombarda]|uniref:EamA domain-containing protein n=1 Tax=Bombardia bombarda TaxID=252184 RepID=A0AA40CEX3_9PEZI|nr:hypothetical protein B0T17DRAFT_483134 [Bombardia bombarda]